MSPYLLSTYEGPLNDVYNILRCLQKNLPKNPGMIEFDPYCVPTGDKLFKARTRQLEDWKHFYPDAPESRSRKKLEPLGEPVTVWVYVDANHAGTMENRRSHYGILIYNNNTPINFYIKINNTVENNQVLVWSSWH